MVSDWIVKALNVNTRCFLRLFPCFKNSSPQHFAVYRLEHGLHHGIIKAVSLAAHGRGDAMLLQELLAGIGAMLATPVGMMNEPARQERVASALLRAVVTRSVFIRLAVA